MARTGNKMVLHQCRLCESKVYFQFSVRLKGTGNRTDVTFLPFIHGVSAISAGISVVVNQFIAKQIRYPFLVRMKTIWRKKKSSAKCIFVLYQWLLDRCGTSKWQLQDYILLNILKWKNLGKSACNIFSLACKPIRKTPDNIERYTDIYTFFLVEIQHKVSTEQPDCVGGSCDILAFGR